MKPLKPKKCRHCREQFTPRNSLQIVCSHICSIKYEDAKKAKKAEKVAKAKRKTHRDELNRFRNNDKALQLTLAQMAFNAWVRKRDGSRCISCGTESPNIQYAAGHYRSVGATKGLALDGIALRFHPENVHVQCNKRCNRELSGNILEYRINLVKKIGIDRVEAIENANERIKLTIEDIREIRKTYQDKLKEELCVDADAASH